jgi:DNA modification methylase
MTARFTLHHGDCREVLRDYPDNHFDSIVSDPPYGLTFMGKGWDRGVPNEEFWQEAFRVAKPGAYLLTFGGTRTFHRLTCAIEDAGWEVRDCLMWLYGSGFPKSHDVSKAIDKAAGAERPVVGKSPWSQPAKSGHHAGLTANNIVETEGRYTPDVTAPATEAAKQWEGWGTALKPAWEPIVLARKPLEGTVAATVLKYGTGALNIDGCRVAHTETFGDLPNRGGGRVFNEKTFAESGFDYKDGGPNKEALEKLKSLGRFPANVITDGSDEVVAGFPNEEGRFFYCAKASSADRDDGNTHPTVKPTDLMRYLCRLVTQPNGLVLDPFMGSGSTGKAALLEGFQFVGIDLEPAYVEIAKARCEHAEKKIDMEKLKNQERSDASQLDLFGETLPHSKSAK